MTVLSLVLTACSQAAPPPPPTRPPAGGYLQLKPVGGFLTLPDDGGAATLVHQSPWEPRPDNIPANHAVPPTDFRPDGYPGMTNGPQVFSRISGNYAGTTDEVLQWSAAKWGLPDDVMRGIAVVESQWYQNHKDTVGKPTQGQGYGGFGTCGGSPPGAPYGPDGPASFGITGVPWCSLNDPNAPGYGGWPWTENSTAYAADTAGAIIRACYEGWEPQWGPTYHAGDLWGCVGRWMTGTWNTPQAQAQVTMVQQAIQQRPWNNW
ncbi:hypothetical protein [Actinomycetospora sp. TBRC 11914]|uniref:hypothetical protein n=1 Tax=Actinomycetospora sp. TBRC 11914 TaxID=2729387 RepID=UPI00145ED705|nr:hypothetical protein [Actinomycetospora sp. TBRC 11914]NMO88386.1 hypothetical protein [Actinomycetospora sp. TBRC 11914]